MKFIFLVFTLFAITANAQQTCAGLFRQAPQHVYPAGVDPITMPQGFMQIGYEAEYLFAESPAILRDYCPKDLEYNEWLALTDSERVVWLKSKFQDKPEYAAATGLFKKVDLDFMPNELIVDSTGNVEIVLAPFDTEGDWSDAVDTIVARYGVGSQQAMVSEPREAFFTPTLQKGLRKRVKQATGWLVFTNMRDMFAKLQSGANRYKKDPTKLSAQFVDHAFLGPMTKIKRDVMEEFLRENARGRMYSEENKQYVRKYDSSFKFTGGPSYRPDIAGPARVAWEIRNAHKDVDDLKMKVKRDIIAHAHGLDSYQAFSKVPAFDTLETFARFDQTSQDALKTLFPSKADPRFKYSDDDHRSLESYRNFAMPLQNLRQLAHALLGNTAGMMFLEKKIGVASKAYVAGVRLTADKLKAGTITPEQAKADVMGLLCLWSVDSGLSDAFDIRASLIGHEPAALDALARAG